MEELPILLKKTLEAFAEIKYFDKDVADYVANEFKNGYSRELLQTVSIVLMILEMKQCVNVSDECKKDVVKFGEKYKEKLKNDKKDER